MKAIWNNEVIAESDDIVQMEGNSYFPIHAVKHNFFQESPTHTVCHWKGTASYYNIEVNGELGKDMAWYYPNPSGLAESIKNRVAFGKDVQVTE